MRQKVDRRCIFLMEEMDFQFCFVTAEHFVLEYKLNANEFVTGKLMYGPLEFQLKENLHVNHNLQQNGYKSSY